MYPTSSCWRRQQSRDEQAAHDGEGHQSPEDRWRDWDQTQHGRDRRQHDGPEAGERRLDHRGPDVASLRALGLDLIDQDDGVARDHADQREDAQNRHEPERPVGEQERENDADQSERHRRDDQRDAPETV